MSCFKQFVLLVLIGFMPIGQAAAAVPADRFLQQVQNDLLVYHSSAALRSLDEMQMRIDRILVDADQTQLGPARLSFARLVRHWKAIETIYVAGVLNEDFIDHPRFIDHYHQGHVSIEETLKPILQSNRKLAKAMFKSSSKGINALEYLLFANAAQDPRRWQAALISIAFIHSWLAEIDEFYRGDTALVSAGEKSLSLLVNALVDSSFRLLNWRVGEAAGLVPKYRDKPSAERLEYYRSGLSLVAIRSILDTHARVFILGVESGYLSTDGRDQGLEEIAFVRGLIDAAQTAASVLPDSGGDVASAEFTELFKRVEALHKAYYFLLVDAMGFKGKIVDADGD